MKEKQLELLEKVKNGTLTPKQAQKQLLGLFSVIPSAYGIFQHENDKVFGYFHDKDTADDICSGLDDSWYVDELNFTDD